MFTEKTTEYCKQACTSMGDDFDKIMSAGEMFPERHRRSNIAYALLCICIENINKQKDPEWKPDYYNANDKYWTWHLVQADSKRPAGFGFSVSSYVYGTATAGVASRLCFGDQDWEKESREVLEELYIAYKL